MKKGILLVGVLIGSCGVVRSERSYMDTIKMGDDLRRRIQFPSKTIEGIVSYMEKSTIDHCSKNSGDTLEEITDMANKIKEVKNVTQSMNKDAQNLCRKCMIPYFLHKGNNIKFYLNASSNTINTDNDESVCLKRLRHSAWYEYQSKSSLLSLNTVAWATERLVYPVIDSNVEAGVDALSEFEFVKNITKNIPVEHRQFLDENGKFVLAASINRAWRVYVDQGVDGFNGENLKIFGKDAAMQFSCAAAEEYAVKPIVKKIVGSDEDSFSKDALSTGLNIAAFCAINSLK